MTARRALLISALACVIGLTLVGLKHVTLGEGGRSGLSGGMALSHEAHAQPETRVAAVAPSGPRRTLDIGQTAAASVVTAPDASAPRRTVADHGRSEDLFGLAMRRADSDRAAELLDGWWAASTCISVSASREVLQRQALLQGQGPEGREQQRAAAALLHRCKGFLDNDLSANLGLRARLVLKLSQHPDVYVPGPVHVPMTDLQFARAVEHGDALGFRAAFNFGFPDRLASRLASSDADRSLVGLAFAQAACDLGLDCSAEGVDYLLGCGLAGRCNGSLEAFWQHGLDVEERARVRRFRDGIVAAVRARDLSYFGLPRR